MKKSNKKSIYLAGPMRGYPEYNFPEFLRFGEQLKKKGFNVFNPAERDTIQDGFDPKKDTAKSLKWYMSYDLPAVCNSDAIAVMPGWEHSQGARLEVHVAREIDIPVFNIFDILNGRVII
jgi:hypothetical protein